MFPGVFFSTSYFAESYWPGSAVGLPSDQLIQSGIGPQSIPPLSVAMINTALAVSVLPSGLQVWIAPNGTSQVIVLTNPILGS